MYKQWWKTNKCKGIPRKTTIRNISALQLKRDVRKGCKAYAVTITDEKNLNKTDKLKLEDIPVLREYVDVFLEEISGLPPKRELDFTIELVPGAVWVQYPAQRPLIGWKYLKLMNVSHN